jgi:hypothetical protein
VTVEFDKEINEFIEKGLPQNEDGLTAWYTEVKRSALASFNGKILGDINAKGLEYVDKMKK